MKQKEKKMDWTNWRRRKTKEFEQESERESEKERERKRLFRGIQHPEVVSGNPTSTPISMAL